MTVGSTLITSAPCALNIVAATAQVIMVDNSMILTPASGCCALGWLVTVIVYSPSKERKSYNPICRTVKSRMISCEPPPMD